MLVYDINSMAHNDAHLCFPKRQNPECHMEHVMVRGLITHYSFHAQAKYSTLQLLGFSALLPS